MGIKININGLKNGVNPKLEKVNTILEKVVDSITSLDIPNDFSYKSTLKNYPSKIRDIKKDIRTIKKDITKIITDFEKAEKNNALLLNQSMAQMDTVIPQLSLNDKTPTTKNDTDGKAKNNANNSNKEATKQGDSIFQTGAKVVDSVVSVNKKFYSSLLKKAGSALSSGSNMSLSFFKGLANIGEHILDADEIIEKIFDSPKTVPIDVIRYLFTKDKKNFTSLTKSAWKDTMTEVSTKHVENAFNNFYSKTTFGKFLNEHASKYFKSDGTASNISSGFGEVIGIAAVSLLTAGVGGVATGSATAGGAVAGGTTAGSTTAVAGVTAISSFGKYTEEYWAKAQDSSWEGMKKKYEAGEITAEQFNSFQMIRNISVEDWKEIETEYKNGKISKEQFEIMEQIREMPDDWKTIDTAFKGLVSGTANGIWDGIQWYVGGKLASWTVKGSSKAATSGIKIGADAILDGSDTFVKAGIDASTSDKSFDEAWIEQGGWKAVLLDSGLSLVGKMDVDTTIGFSSSSKNIANHKWALLDTFDIKTLDEAIELSIKKNGQKVTKELVQVYKKKLINGDITGITKNKYARAFVEEYLNTEINSIDDAIELTLRTSGHKTQNINARRLQIQKALANGDLSCITRFNGARTFVKNIYNWKSKKYLDIKTNDKIFQLYGGLSEKTNQKIVDTLKSMHIYLNSGKIDGNMNFVKFLEYQNIDKTMKNDLTNYAKYNTWFRNLSLREAQSIYSYCHGSRIYTKVFRWRSKLVSCTS